MSLEDMALLRFGEVYARPPGKPLRVMAVGLSPNRRGWMGIVVVADPKDSYKKVGSLIPDWVYDGWVRCDD